MNTLVLFILILLFMYFMNNKNIIENYPYYYEKTIHWSTKNKIGGLKVHFYDFDKVITSNDLLTAMMQKRYQKDMFSLAGGGNYTIDKLYLTGELYDVFGSKERVDSMRKYFRFLKSQGIKLYIVSFNKTEYIKKALGYMKLYEYFDEIHGQDMTNADQIISSYDVEPKSDLAFPFGNRITMDKAKIIRQIMKKLNIPLYKGILIDDMQRNLAPVSEFMYTYRPIDRYYGLQKKDMHKLLNLTSTQWTK